MSTASISYSSLKDASNEAKAVAKKLNKYADTLYNNVYDKFNKYDGSWSSNLSEAKSYTNTKISLLRAEQNDFETYATDLIDLCDECKEVDKAVKSKVSSLTASFKEAHGIRNSNVENAISYVFTGLGNETAFGRWVGGKKDAFDAGVNYFKESIKEWYNYDGGKELIKGTIVGSLEVVIGVLTIIGAAIAFAGLVAASAVTGGAILVFIAGVVGGAIAVVNGVANICNEKKAYSATQGNDPATGRRRSEIDSWQGYLRSSFIFGDSGENYEYNKWYNGFALGIDLVNLACMVVTVVNSAGNLLKNGYKWATGNAAKVKDITMKQIFSKDTVTAFRGKFADIKTTFQVYGWNAVKDFGNQILKDFGRNLRGKYWDFYETNGDFNWKGAVSSIKNMLSIPKDILSDGLTIQNIGKIGWSSIILPGVTAFTVNSTKATIVTGEGGQLQFDFTEKVTIGEIVGLFEKGAKIGKTVIELTFHNSSINVDVMDKLSTACNEDISIPKICIPNIEMPIVREGGI